MKAAGFCQCGCGASVKKKFVHNHHRVRSAIERFWEKVVQGPEGCWVWNSRRGAGGYGKFFWGKHEGYAHRFAYFIFVGEIPAGLELDHLCENLWCVNPDHLEAVTHRENLLRSSNHQNSITALYKYRPSPETISKARKQAVKTQKRAVNGRFI